MEVPKIKEWLNEKFTDQYGNVTVLIPGGFKPISGAHLDLIKRYSQNPAVKEVRVIIGPKTRDGIDQNLGVKIAKSLTSNLSNVKIEKSKFPSPILTAYKKIEKLKSGYYALGSSSKGGDYKRVLDFTKQHQEGGKYYEGVPKNVNIIELPIDSEPVLFKTRQGEHNGTPISASILRQDILDKNYKQFSSGYPDNDEHQIQTVWNLLIGKLQESSVAKTNTHMTHAEDLILFNGEKGLEWVLDMFGSLYDELKSNIKKGDIKLSVKIDGAPSLLGWSNFHSPNILPKMGIAMKGLFDKNPKIFTTQKQIKEEFKDRPELVYKLITFLKYLPYINIPKNEIWQGDFLFDDKSLQETEIGGERHYAFHPNTIYYVVPKDSNLGGKIKKAKIGITWHTRYTGKDLSNLTTNYNTDISNLTLNDKILMTDPYVKSFAGLVNFTEEESLDIETRLKDLLKYSDILKSDEYQKINNQTLIKLFSIFQNSLIKISKNLSDPNKFIKEFKKFITIRSLKESDKRKSEKGKNHVILKFAELIDDINIYKKEWMMLIHIINETTELKELFIKKLNNIGKFQTYLKTKEGKLQSTNQEGFACSDIDNNIIKLVDRSEFSYANFSPDIQKGWDINQ